MDNAHLERGRLLLSQGRADLAEPELRKALAADPDDGVAHALLAICLTDLGDPKGGYPLARSAVQFDAGNAFCHFALAYVVSRTSRSWRHTREAVAAAEEAIRLDPEDADYWGLLAEIHLLASRHRLAVDAAAKGLRIDPEHTTCLNVRGAAAAELGNLGSAGDDFASSLGRNPESSQTQCATGWWCLYQRRYREAESHFRTAAAIDPGVEEVRYGLTEAIKSRFWIVRPYAWMFHRPDSAGDGFLPILMIVTMLGFPVLCGASYVGPREALFPCLAIGTIFAHYFLGASQAFDWVLLFSRDGWAALPRERRVAGSAILVMDLAAAVAWGCYAVVGLAQMWSVGLVLATLPLAVAHWLRSEGTGRKWSSVWAVVTVAVGVSFAACDWASSIGVMASRADWWGSRLLICYLIGVIMMPFVGMAYDDEVESDRV